MSVMISIKPKWCELIASGRKTIEVRKTRPKLETPFKCYIYCTKGDTYRLNGHRTNACYEEFWIGAPLNSVSKGRYVGNGKVIGEFVCDAIITDRTLGHDGLFNGAACMTVAEVAAYATSTVYGWHISDLVIYDKPKELKEFGLTRPPQSWCYCEEVCA